MKRHIAPLFAALALLFSIVGCAATGSSSASATPQMAPAPAASAAARDSGYMMDDVEPDDEVMYEEEALDYLEEDMPEEEPDFEEGYDMPATGGGETAVNANPGTAGEVMPEIPEDSQSDDPPAGQPRKIIYNVDLSLQTTAFDEGVESIPVMVAENGGFIENSYIEGANMEAKYYSRSASFTARIPSEDLDAFLARLDETFHVVYEQKNSSDITAGYYDTQARLDSLRIQEQRLKAMLQNATELKYMLEVERELSDVLYRIESLTSSIRRMDSSVKLSTVTIRLQEVNTITEEQPVVKPVTFGERAAETLRGSFVNFVRFCENLLLFLIAMLPMLPVFAVIAVIVILVLRSNRARLAKRRASAAEKPALPESSEEKPAPPEDSAE